jgi:hypothetical protein
MEEALHVINNTNLTTYVCHNGSSAIDLVFSNLKGINTNHQKAVWDTSNSPIRKHLPIAMYFSVKRPSKQREAKIRCNTLRRINPELLKNIAERPT